MYEINLVPNVKTELLEKQKLRNLVILICIVLSAASMGVVAILGGIAATQAITIASKDAEIKCRSTGEGNCSGKDTAVYRFSNIGELLTTQGQMYDLSLLNSNRLVFSRIFPMFDVILPAGKQGTMKVSNVVANFDDMSFTIEANSKDSVGYTVRESFAKGLEVTYFDYGHYMRKDNSTGEYVEIPSYCIKEETIDGYLYGRYMKGALGCETSVIDKAGDDEDDEGDEPVEIEEILIRRTYQNEKDLERYKEGDDILADLVDEKHAGYYFQSECISYDGVGKVDEAATIEKCGFSTEKPRMIEGSYGSNQNGNMVLTFSAQFFVNREAFLAKNKHMIFVGPTKRNVTDSYLPVRDMFSATETVIDEEGA